MDKSLEFRSFGAGRTRGAVAVSSCPAAGHQQDQAPDLQEPNLRGSGNIAATAVIYRRYGRGTSLDKKNP